MRGKQILSAAAALLVALFLVACGDDEESTVTETQSETEAVTETVTAGPGSSETADLPLCAEVPADVVPCLNADGSVETTPGGGAPTPGGETADLPTCDSAPPPCRNPDGTVVEP